MKKYTDLEKDRIKLRDQVPLKTPFSMQVEVTNYCNYACTFCVHSYPGFEKSYTGRWMHMDPNLFYKMVDDLKEFPEKLKTMRLFLLGEPLMAPALADELDYLMSGGVTERVEITTNAVLLNESKARELLEVAKGHPDVLLYVRYSIETIIQERNEKLTGNPVKIEQIRENVRRFQELRDEMGLNAHVFTYAKMFSVNEEENREFQRLYQGLADEVGFDILSNNTNRENGKIDLIAGYQESAHLQIRDDLPKVCHFPFMFMQVCADGTAKACCPDYTMDTAIGNIKNESVKDIWNGEKLKNIRRIHLEHRREVIDACRFCQVLSDKESDNLDDVPVTILDN